jgi:hypothetical protein
MMQQFTELWLYLKKKDVAASFVPDGRKIGWFPQKSVVVEDDRYRDVDGLLKEMKKK